jgi:four helix bundle protein
MKTEDLRKRIKLVALRVIKLSQALSKNTVGNIIGKQILRSGTSIAANYYSACKARSRKDFISKVGIAEEEADETLLWLELIVDSHLIDEKRVKDLIMEMNEIISILAASRITAKKREAGIAVRNSSDVN